VIKRILIPLDPSPYSESALQMACIIAKEYDAEVTGMVILDIPGIEDSIGPVPIGGIHLAEKLEKEKKEEAQHRIEELIEKFKATCRKEGVQHREAERQGSPSVQILNESIYYDLLIIGLRTYFHFETSEKYGSSLDKLLKESVTPIYSVPEKLLFSEKPDRKIRILMAFDGSPLAARAMQRFTQLIIPDLYEIMLLNSSEDRESGESLLSRAEEYLNSHNITNIQKVWTSDDIIDVIKNEYYDSMDGFVLGAHSRDGIFDFLVGSLTKYLVKSAKKPVFIGQ
jgi:nucleotide-binding universal stress UspA family protein